METKFTPGPWQCQHPDGRFMDTDWTADNEYAWRTTLMPILDAENNTVALVVRTDWNDAQIEADARLIVAAPELFEALQSLVFWYAKRAGNDMLPDAEQEPEIVAARAALAKATGEQA